MKKFKGQKTFDEIVYIMKNKGMKVDTTDFDKGDDWCFFKGAWNHLPLTIAYNTVNSRFIVYNGFTGKQMATESSGNLENEEWYSELLNTFYVA
jgi:translation elongation factor EF-1alpha